MQTFLPYASFRESARALDNKRLGKQRVECLQILKALTLPTYGWQNHPAVNMWRGYERAFIAYSLDVCDAWVARGYKDTCHRKIIDLAKGLPLLERRPHWLGDEAVHASHRSNLLRKDPQFYGKYAWSEPDHLPYVWPLPGR